VIELHAFDDPLVQADALARAVGDALQARLGHGAAHGHATFAVSGGSSPRRFLKVLSGQPFDWSRIDLTLVDDRWVPDDDKDSNVRFVRENLLQNAAAQARFTPLVDVTREPAEQIARLNASTEPALPDVAVLGMGDDGHTASIFADAPEWREAITTEQRFVLVHPGAAPHARVSWSMSALKRIDRLFLLIAGKSKLDVLEKAAASPLDNAISKLANDKGVTLDVYWSAE
jgi:6-phosphogluconolactonase